MFDLGLVDHALRSILAQATDADEWTAEYELAPSEVLLRTPDDWIYLTKPQSAQQRVANLLGVGSIPSVFGRPTLAPMSHLQKLTNMLASTSQIWFLGDLDPHDLMMYASTSARLAQLSVNPDRIHYLGLSDRFLQVCANHDRHANHGKIPALVQLKQSRIEPVILRELMTLSVDWTSIIGPESRALLQAGKKIELEGALNGSFYQSGFDAALGAFLRRELSFS